MTQDTVIPAVQVISTPESEIEKSLDLKNESLDDATPQSVNLEQESEDDEDSEDDEYLDESETEDNPENNVSDPEHELISTLPEKFDALSATSLITLPADLGLHVEQHKPILLPAFDLNDPGLISSLPPLAWPENPGAFIQESLITLPPDIKLPLDEQKPIIDKPGVSDEMNNFEAFVQGIGHIVANPENPGNPDEIDLLFIALHKALTQFSFEAGYQLYQDMIGQKIWFKDNETGTFGVDVENLARALREFFQEHVAFPDMQNDIPEIPIYNPEEISTEDLREQGFMEFLNAIKPLVDKPENDSYQLFLDKLYVLAQSPYGYELYNYLVQEGVWIKDETGEVTFEIEKLPKILDAFFEAHAGFSHVPNILPAIVVDKPEEISETPETPEILLTEMQESGQRKDQESANKEENTHQLPETFEQLPPAMIYDFWGDRPLPEKLEKLNALRNELMKQVVEQDTHKVPETSEQPQQHEAANSTLSDVIKPSSLTEFMESLTPPGMLSNQLKQLQEYMKSFDTIRFPKEDLIDIHQLNLPAVTTAFSIAKTYLESTYYNFTFSTNSNIPVYENTNPYSEAQEPVPELEPVPATGVLEVL